MSLTRSALYHCGQSVDHRSQLRVGESLTYFPQFLEQHRELHLIEHGVPVGIDESKAPRFRTFGDQDFVEPLVPPGVSLSLAALIFDLDRQAHIHSVAG